jgi:hypothetical protein
MSSRNDARVPYPLTGGTQAASFTGTAAAISNAVGQQTRRVLVYATQDCHIQFASTPVATTADCFLPASVSMFLSIRPGEKVSAIRASVDGTIYVSEMDY